MGPIQREVGRCRTARLPRLRRLLHRVLLVRAMGARNARVEPARRVERAVVQVLLHATDLFYHRRVDLHVDNQRTVLGLFEVRQTYLAHVRAIR